MNGWSVLILLVLATAVASTPRNTPREGLLKVFNKWRNNDVSSLPFKLPSSRNIHIGDQSRSYQGYVLTLIDAVLGGLETSIVERLSMSESGLKAALAINIPELKISTDDYYNLYSTKVWNLLNDSGSRFWTKVSNFGLTADVRFGTDGTNTVIESLTLDYTFGPIESYLSGSYSYVEHRFEQNVKKYLREEKSQIIEEATTFIKNNVNNMLRGYTPEQLINIIREV